MPYDVNGQAQHKIDRDKYAEAWKRIYGHREEEQVKEGETKEKECDIIDTKIEREGGAYCIT